MQEKQLFLTNENVSNINIECGKTVDFHQRKMKFLKKPILYTFKESVNLKRSAYGMVIQEISSSDKGLLNSLLSRLGKSMLIKDYAYINSKEVPENTYDKGYVNKDKWMLTIEIQGTKKFNNEASPIWKIQTVQKVE